MKIDVFGAVFLDRYIYDQEFNTEIIESIGGSGLSIALGLHIFGHDVRFYGNIGNDDRKDKIFNILKDYKFPVDTITIKDGVTGLFIAKNDKVFSVERGVNDEPITIEDDILHGEYAIITTEINKSSIQRILEYKWKKIFLDVGPRPFILKDIQLSQDMIKIGNSLENKIISCNIVKLGSHGAKWGNIVISGNNILLPYTIGAGDLFDTILIDNLLKGIYKKEALKRAVELAEISCTKIGGFKIDKIKHEIKTVYNEESFKNK